LARLTGRQYDAPLTRVNPCTVQEDDMTARKMVLVLGACVVGAALAQTGDPNMGTWKLNEAKSKFSAGAAKNDTVVYAAAGDSVKVTVDGVDGAGKKTHSEWTGKFDGKEYPVTGEANGDMRAYTRVNARTLGLTQTKAGKVTMSGRIVVAPDGKSRTVTMGGITADGKKFSTTAVYDKQ
jgi:hypothetical protein